MNAHNTTPNYMAPGHVQTITYGQPPPPPPPGSKSENRIDKAYVTSIRGLLKITCLVSEEVVLSGARN